MENGIEHYMELFIIRLLKPMLSLSLYYAAKSAFELEIFYNAARFNSTAKYETWMRAIVNVVKFHGIKLSGINLII